jgi:hypothetical protein
MGSACQAAMPHAVAIARVVVIAAVIGVPMTSSLGPAGPRIAFSYVAAAPAPWLETRVLAQASTDGMRAASGDGMRAVAAGKRRPKRPSAASI